MCLWMAVMPPGPGCFDRAIGSKRSMFTLRYDGIEVGSHFILGTGLSDFFSQLLYRPYSHLLKVRDYTFNWTFLEYRKEIEVKLFPLALMWTISISENLSKVFFSVAFSGCALFMDNVSKSFYLSIYKQISAQKFLFIYF